MYLKKIKYILAVSVFFCFVLKDLLSHDFVSNLNENVKKNKIESIGEVHEVKNANNETRSICIKDLVIEGYRIESIFTDLEKKSSKIVIQKLDIEKGLLDRNKKGIKEIVLTFDKFGKVMAEGKILFLGSYQYMNIEAEFKIDNELEFILEMKRGSIGYFSIPRSIVKWFSRKINPIFKLKNLGVPLYLSKITLIDNRLIIS